MVGIWRSMKLIAEMTEEEKRCVTPETIAYHRVDLTEEEVIARIKYLLEKQKRELTEHFTEEDYDKFYESAKEAWKAVDMPIRGNTKEIKECMTTSLERLGMKGVKTKADFMRILKSEVNLLTLQDEVRKVILGG